MGKQRAKRIKVWTQWSKRVIPSWVNKNLLHKKTKRTKKPWVQICSWAVGLHLRSYKWSWRQQEFNRLSLHAFLLPNKLIKGWFAVALIEEEIGQVLMHGFCKVNTIPVNVLVGIFTGGCTCRSTQGINIKVESFLSSSTTSLKGLFKLVVLMIRQYGLVCIPVISIHNHTVTVLTLNLRQPLLEEFIVSSYHRVCTCWATHSITVVGRTQGQV